MIKNGILRDSPELFLHMFNSMQDMIFIMSVNEHGDYDYLFANKAACTFTGLNEECYGKPMKKFLSGQIYDFIRDKYDEAVKQKETIHYIDKFSFSVFQGKGMKNNTSNRMEYHESTITPVFNENGECTHILALVRDITEQKQREKELKHAKEQLELIWNSTADAIYSFNSNQNFVNVNHAFENLFGWKNEELLSDLTISIIPNKDRAELESIIEKLKKGHSIPLHQVQRVTKEGQIVDVLASYSPLYDHDGNWEGGVAVYKDVTELTNSMKKLEESEERYRLITEHSSDLIKVTDKNGIILYASPSHFFKLGVNPEQAISNSITSSVIKEDREKFAAMIREINNTREPAAVDFRRYNSDGEIKWFHTIGTPILDEQGEIERIIYVARNITERKMYEEKLEQLALYDSLTGQLNRRTFYKKLENEIECTNESKQILSVMLLDLDRFKNINDTMGHDIGDELLIMFTKRVESCLREQDILARLGGDEFAILMPNLSTRDEAIEMANRIIESLQKEWEIGEYCFSTTSSMGIAFYPPIDQNKKQLLKHADLALYSAKEAGRNNFKVYQER